MYFMWLVIGMWLCATVGCMCTKDSEPFGYATVATIATGFGYFILQVL